MVFLGRLCFESNKNSLASSFVWVFGLAILDALFYVGGSRFREKYVALVTIFPEFKHIYFDSIVTNLKL